MIWDAPLTTAVASELDEALGGARLRAFHLDHAGPGALVWFREATLSIRLGADEGHLVLQDAAEPLEEARTLAADVRGVEAPPDDRILLLRMRRPRGAREPVLIVVELMTNQWNVVVARGRDLRVRHLLREREGARDLRAGAVWTPPPPSEREGMDGDLSPRRWRELVDAAPPERRRGVLLSRVAWTSSLNADALLGHEGEGQTAGRDASGGLDAPPRGHALWRRIVGAAREPEPVLLQLHRGAQPYPLPLPGAEATPRASLLDALAEAREEADGAGPTVLPTSWLAELEKRVRSAEGRVRGLRRELENAPDPADARAVGDLLLARFHEVPRGRDRVTLTGFDGESVEVELDPTLDPQENAARWYDRAARAERARERLPGMVADAEEAAREARELLERARSGDADPDEIRRALPDPSAPEPRKQGGPTLPYRTFRSSGGLEIRVGRGAKHNDDLSFHHSDPDDVWMHARHAAGAHVILRWSDEGNPPARDLGEAAVLAALHSKARTSGSVPVDWTRRKYVRKPRKSPPGRVVPDRISTVFVEPDPDLAERLREE